MNYDIASRPFDLNLLNIPGEESSYRRAVTQNAGDATVYFDGLADALIGHILQADIVLGCVAWMTHLEILEALQIVHTAIVVQKEDFLRPDGTSNQDLRAAYGRLHCGIERHLMPGLMRYLSVSADPVIDPVRCCGNHNRNRAATSPRMHHKFLVFAKGGDLIPGPHGYDVFRVEPYAVWTGSFNFTNNGSRSFENALFIQNKQLAEAYYNEFAHVFALSEPLNWEDPWVAPEYRIGT
jgi:hypothetical protein